MRLLIILAVAVVVLVLAARWRDWVPSSREGQLDLKYQYLVVTADGPAEWAKQHRFTIDWEGKPVQLPVILRVPTSSGLSMGAGPEAERYLKIGEQRFPVTADPATEFHVRNTGTLVILPEESDKRGGVGLSVVTWVTISPPSYPGFGIDPDSREEAQKELKAEFQKLLAAGKTIDVPVR
jgi:hypothetical protein